MRQRYTFVESSAFERWRSEYLDDDEYARLQAFMVLDPQSGELIRGSGGVRKMRWPRPGRGRRGGLRIIYHVRNDPNEIWLLTLYSKSRHDSIPSHVLRQLMEAFRDG